MEKNNLNQRLKEIDAFFQNLSLEDFEKMAFECGLGTIKPSADSNYVLASNIRYKNQMSSVTCTKDNEFYISRECNLKGAA